MIYRLARDKAGREPVFGEANMVEHERTGPVDWMNWTFSRICMWLPAFIVAIIFYEVFMRYILFKPTLWVNEMSLWLGGAIYVTSGLYAMQQRSHIRITVLYDLAPLWLRRFFDLLALLCVCIFVFAVVWGGYGEAAAKFWRWEAFGTAFDPPIPATNKPLDPWYTLRAGPAGFFQSDQGLACRRMGSQNIRCYGDRFSRRTGSLCDTCADRLFRNRSCYADALADRDRLDAAGGCIALRLRPGAGFQQDTQSDGD